MLHAEDHKPSISEPQMQVQSYLRFRDLLEAAPDGIFEVEQDGTIILLNAAAEAMFGYTREEFLGQLVEKLIPQAARSTHRQHRAHFSQHPSVRPMGAGLELLAVRKDGRTFPVEISLSPIRSAEGNRVIAVVRDITDRKKAEAEIHALQAQFTASLTEANRQLEIRNREVERANRLKSEFLASMSHELRTPLHTIIGFSDLLAEELKGPLNETQKRFVEHIRNDSRHLLALISDTLDFSKIEAGRLTVHPEEFNAAEKLAGWIERLRSLANAKKQTILEAYDANVTVFADPTRLKEILYNLVSNAIKFTPDGGTITIEARQADDQALFRVTDTGIGIPEAEYAAIFDTFYQLGPTTKGVREGTGLGLSITKSLVEMHGGEIRVRSKLGEGSVFEFNLPLENHATGHALP
jgi:PAS domain S-box-containing protein